MTRVAERLAAKQGFDIVHCRSYLPALVGARLKRRFGLRFLFDMRGFWADERVEGGLWSLDKPVYRSVYRWFKKQETRLLAEADHVVVLTEAAREILRREWAVPERIPVTVIPCCADFSVFQPIDPASRRLRYAGAGSRTVPAPPTGAVARSSSTSRGTSSPTCCRASCAAWWTHSATTPSTAGRTVGPVPAAFIMRRVRYTAS